MKALLLIDIQKGLTNRKGLYNKSIFIDTVNDTIHKFRESGNLIVFLQHNNKQLKYGENNWEIETKIDKRNEDIIFQKEHGNAFEKTDLDSTLKKHNIEEIFVCGLVSHGCIKLTCIGGINSGYKTNLIMNGHTNWNKDAELKINATESELRQIGVKIIDIYSSNKT